MDTTTILQLATILAVIGSFFGLYRLLVSQKDATIESARQQTETIKQQIELIRAESESVVARQLNERVSIMEQEFERIAKRKKRFEDKRAEKFGPDMYKDGRTPKVVLQERVQEVWEEWYEEFREELEAEKALRNGEAEQ